MITGQSDEGPPASASAPVVADGTSAFRDGLTRRRLVQFFCLPGSTSLLAILFVVRIASGADWPEWRGGPHRDGQWSEPGLSAKLPPDGPKIIWKAVLGSGYSGPAVANGRVFVMDRLRTTNDIERVVCLDAKSGHELWIHTHPSEPRKAGYDNGPRSTPTVDGPHLYTLGGMGQLHCLGAADGQIIWSHDLRAEFSARIPRWGAASAPLVEGSLIMVQAGGLGDACVMAFDKMSGKEAWRAIDDMPGYSALVAIDSGGRRQLIAWTATAIWSLDPKTGAVFWKHPRKLYFEQAVATPMFCAEKNLLLIASDREGTIALKLDDAKPGFQVAWDNLNYNALHGSAVLVGDKLYGLNHNGNVRNECGELRCIDLATGEKIWSTNSVTKMALHTTASVTRNRANGLFYITNEPGELIIAEADAQGYRQLYRASLTGTTWSHPAYANGFIYARAENQIICAELK